MENEMTDKEDLENEFDRVTNLNLTESDIDTIIDFLESFK